MPINSADEFLDQLSEVLNDAATSYVYAAEAPRLPVEFWEQTAKIVLQTLQEHESNPEGLISALSAMMLHMFMAGRVHAERGYPSPLESGEPEDSSIIPDYLDF